MPSYKVNVEGRSFNVNAPDPDTAWAWAWDYAKTTPTTPAAPTEKPETGGWSALKAGFESGTGSAAKGIGDLIGSETLSKWGEEALHTAEKTHRATTAADIEAADKQGILAGLGARTSKYVTEPVGEAVGSIAGRYGAPIAAGLAAAPIATAAGAPVAASALIGGAAFGTINTLLHTGENVSRQKETGAEVDRVKATAYALAQNAIDQVGGRIIAGPMRKIIGTTIGEEATVLAKKVVDGSMKAEDATMQLISKANRVKDIAQATVQNAAVGTGMMVGTEGLRRASADQGVLTPDALEAYKEQAKMAVALSPFFGIAHGVGAQRGALKTLGDGITKREVLDAEEAKKAKEEAEKDVPDTVTPPAPAATTAPAPAAPPGVKKFDARGAYELEVMERELTKLREKLDDLKDPSTERQQVLREVADLEAKINAKKAPAIEDVPDLDAPNKGPATGEQNAPKPNEPPVGGDVGVPSEPGVPKTPGDAEGTQRAGVPPVGENARDAAAGKGTADGALNVDALLAEIETLKAKKQSLLQKNGNAPRAGTEKRKQFDALDAEITEKSIKAGQELVKRDSQKGKPSEAPKTEAPKAEQTEAQGQKAPAVPVDPRVVALEARIKGMENYVNDKANEGKPDYKPTVDALAKAKEDLAALHEQIDKANEPKPTEPVTVLKGEEKKQQGKAEIKEDLEEVERIYNETRNADAEKSGDVTDQMPEWRKLTDDQRQVYTDALTGANLVDPNRTASNTGWRTDPVASHGRARGVLRRYLQSQREVQGETHPLAAPEAAQYEINRQQYERETGAKFPAWEQLTEAQREAYRASLRADAANMKQRNGKPLKPENALKRLNAENYDKAFLAIHQERVKGERAAKEAREARAKAEQESLERQRAERAEQERRQKEQETERQQKADKARNEEAYLPDEQVRNIKSGDTDKATKLLNWFINASTNPLHREVAKLVRAIGLNPTIKFVEKLPKGRVAQYDPRTNTIHVTTDGLKPSILLHELVHGSTVNVIDKFLTGRKGELTKEQLAGVEHLQELMKIAKEDPVMKELFPEAFKDLHEFVSYAMSDRRFQQHLEAIKDVDMPKLDETMLPESKNALSHFVSAVLDVLGGIKKFFSPKTGQMYKTNALAEAFAAFERIVSAPPEGGVDLKPLPATAPTTKQAPKQPVSGAEQAKNLATKVKLEEPKSTLHWTRYFSTRDGYNWLVSKFQNKGVHAKNREDAAQRAGVINHTGPDMNNFWTQRKLSFGRAAAYVKWYVDAPAQRLHMAIKDYADQNKITPREALEQLHLVMAALHEPERRAVKFLKLVPLSEHETIDTLTPREQRLLGTQKGVKGNEISAAEYRMLVIKAMESGKHSTDDMQFLREQLDGGGEHANKAAYDKSIIGRKDSIDTHGFSESGHKATSIDDPTYNVLGELNKDGVAHILNEHYKTPEQKASVDAITKQLGVLNDATTKLNKMGRFWSAPVQSTVDFYGWKNYVSFKGKKNNKGIDPDDFLNYDSRARGRSLQDDQIGFVGRENPGENPLLLAMADANRAASRAGTADLTTAIMNAVKQGIIGGKLEKPVTFHERTTTDAMSKYKKEDYVFHFQEDGSVIPIKIDDSAANGRIIAGLREEYQPPHPVLNFANGLTGTIGQMHTRFNFAFAPMNFVRDALTNVFSTAAQHGMGTAAKYLGVVIKDVATGQIFRAGNMARLYESGDKAAIDRLAGGNKTYDQLSGSERYYRNLKEYIDQGGKVSYLQGLSIKSQLKDVQAEINSGVPSKVKDGITKVFDVWTDSFELAARSSAYSIAKETYIKEATKKGMNAAAAEAEASVRAASYAKSLANFEETGEWGRAMGAVFMFFRPSATGAVRAIDALTPAIMSLERAKYELPESIRKDAAAMKKFEEDYNQHRKMAMLTTGVLFGMGAAVYQMSRTLSDNDDQGRNRAATDDINRWQRYARFFIPGMENPIQLPWGYGLGAFASLGAQMSAVGQGAASAKDVMGNAVSIFMDSFLPIPVSRINPLEHPAQWAVDSTTPSAFRPLLEWAMNMNTMGQEIYNNRQTRMGDAYTGGDNIPEIFKDLSRWIADRTDGQLSLSPNSLYFFANNYADGMSKLAEVGTNLGYVASGKKDFNPKTDTLFLNSFVGAKSNYDAREYSKVESQLQKLEQTVNMFKTNPERYAQYMSDHPEAQFLVDYYHQQVGGMMKKLQHQAKMIRLDSSLTPKERKAMLEDITTYQNLIKRNIIDTVKDFGITP